MYLKLLIISVILVAFVFLALGIKLWFDPDAEILPHSCAFEDGNPDKDLGCSMCGLKDIADCTEVDKKPADMLRS